MERFHPSGDAKRPRFRSRPRTKCNPCTVKCPSRNVCRVTAAIVKKKVARYGIRKKENNLVRGDFYADLLPTCRHFSSACWSLITRGVSNYTIHIDRVCVCVCTRYSPYSKPEGLQFDRPRFATTWFNVIHSFLMTHRVINYNNDPKCNQTILANPMTRDLWKLIVGDS